ncbi:hypothetical protein RUM43_012726 [Polyplax serrata]|uniref:RING-type domain-containing protein n=1 Tax=Polyplax serrata TaxID=468196 RepID=A0AAN8S9Q0_POLSC
MDNTFERVKGIIGRLRNVLKCQKCFTLKEDLNMSFYHQCDHFYCSKCVIEQDLCPVCKNVSDKPRTIASDKNMLILYKSIINYELPSKIDFDVMYEGYKQSKVQYQKVKKSERIEKGCVENEKPVNDNSEMACQKLDAKSSKIKSIESKKRNSHKNSRPIGSLTATLTREGKVNPYSLTGTTEKIRTSTEQLMPLNVNVPDTSKTVITNKSVVTPETSKILNMNTPGSSKTLHITTPKSSKTVRNVTPTSANASNTNTASNSKSLTKLNINKRNPKGETQLHLACKKKDFKWMKDLIAAGANPNAKDNAGWSPLHDSVFSGNVAVIEFLLENGANVNLPGLENTTALHEAIAKGNKRIVEVLLKYGADVNMMNIHRETPM